MDYYKELERKKRRHSFWGDILGGALIIISIATGTAEVVAPLVIVVWLAVMFSGNG